ncbi:MAG: hypothetical protein Q7S68_02135, partial [Deltaproteobacteria bacterium]|nr:hypothetical protein [Deltaproteobacteria bacterium]
MKLLKSLPLAIGMFFIFQGASYAEVTVSQTSTVTMPTGADDFAVSGGIAIVSESGGNYANWIIDISNPESLFLSGSYEKSYDGSGVSDIALSGTTAYIGYNWENYGGPLQIVDISDPTHTALKSTAIDDTKSITRLALNGKYLYVVFKEGLQIFDVSKPSSPILLGAYNPEGFDYGVVVSGNYAYVLNSEQGMIIIDASNSAAPTVKGRYKMSGGARD